MQSEIDLRGLALCEANVTNEFGTPPATLTIARSQGEANAPRQRYDRLSRFLHWSVAIAIIYVLLAGYAMHLVSSETVHNFLSVLNMSVATVITVLMTVRFVWRFFRPAVAHGDHLRSVEKTAAEFAHEVFYLMIFCVLISGFLMLKHSFALFGLAEFPRLVHEDAVNDFFFIVHRISCIALVAMLVLHIAAVIKHQKIDKYPILSRMT